MRIHQNMKKIIAGIIFVLVAICAYAQQDVTQFLGIPVDGPKSEMVKALRKKGFSPRPRVTSWKEDSMARM